MKAWEDYYEILRVPPDATAEQIKEAYLYLINILHPDRLMGTSESIRHKAEEESKRVNRAYDTLKGPEKRRAYHSEWVKHHKGMKEDAEPRSPPAPDRAEKDELRSYVKDDLVEASAKQLLKQFAKYRRVYILPYGFLRKARIIQREAITCFPRTSFKWQVGEEVKSFSALSPSEYNSLYTNYASRFKYIPDSHISSKRRYRVQGSESIYTCGSCRGKGVVRCNVCHGRGWVKCEDCNGYGYTQVENECPVCDGEGFIIEPYVRRSRQGGSINEEHGEIEVRCSECHGSGVIEETETCSYCRGTGERLCDTCNGSGEVDCDDCEGTAKVYGARVMTVKFTPIDIPTTRVLLPQYLPITYLRGMKGEEISREIVHTIDDKVERRIVESIRVLFVKYEFGNQNYILYKVGGRLKFDKYPKSAKKLLTFSAILTAVIFVALSAAGIIDIPNVTLGDVLAVIR